MQWSEIINTILYAVITAVVPVITYFLVNFLREKSKQLLDKLAVEEFRGTIDSVIDLITTTVTYTSQTYVDSLKNAGKFDKEAQQLAFQNTKDTILALLDSESKELINTVYHDVDKWIEVQIENAVHQNKN